jgi:uncharacterized membrane protein
MGRSPLARFGTGLFWIVGGTMHFVVPRSYQAICPPQIESWKREAVIISGIAEIAGGVAVLPERTRRGARWWLLATLAAVYPANIHMAVNSREFERIPRAALWARLPVQFLFGWMTWRGTE